MTSKDEEVRTPESTGESYDTPTQISVEPLSGTSSYKEEDDVKSSHKEQEVVVKDVDPHPSHKEAEKEPDISPQVILQNLQNSLSALTEKVKDLQYYMATEIGARLDKLDAVGETIADIDYNIKTGMSSDGSQNNQYVESLQGQLAEYKEDVFLKLMRKYIIDSQIRLYKRIAYRNMELNRHEELERIMAMIENDLSAIGVESRRTREETDFIPALMTVSDFPSKDTKKEELNSKVAASVIPAFIWALPTTLHNSGTMVLAKEEVILYKFNKE